MRLALLSAFSLAITSVVAEPTREPWTTSRVKGAPTPPKPYVAEVIWPELTFNRVTDIARLPSRELMFLTEQRGKIWILPGDLDEETPEPKLFADLAEGLAEFASSFSIAFHPKFEDNREVYLFYRIHDRQVEDGTRISRFRAFPDLLELDTTTEEILLTFRSGGHNGGHLGFGPDGMLYILTGDSEVPTPPDPLNTGQDLSDLLSSVLRIDVNNRDDGKGYAIPADNPFLDFDGARPEIWAYGFRNPWKLCFLPKTGDLWVGDVGWELWELLMRVERGSNFGWSIVEGPQPIKIHQNPGPSPITPAQVLHPHTEFASITGGHVSETDRLPELKGKYLYGDYVTGQLWGLTFDGSDVAKQEYLADTRLQIVTFGQASGGEVVFMNWPDEQNLFRLVENSQPDESSKFPHKLSETGIFSDVKSQTPEAGVYEFQINGGMWHDGAEAKRWIAIPGKETIISKKNPFAEIPDGTVFAKTLAFGDRPVETQILHYENLAWQGYSYRWNDEQTDAELVGEAGLVTEIDGTPWTFHSRAECMRCHNIGSDYRLAFHPGQLNRDGQLEHFQNLGLVNDVFVEKAKKEAAARYDDSEAPIALKTRTWLSANCAHCHRRRGGGSVTMEMDLATPLEEMAVLGTDPVKGTFGIPGAKLIAPGAPWDSVLYYRSVTTGIGHMPMIGARTVDPTGETLLYEWIASLGKLEPTKPSLDSIPAALELAHQIRSGEVTGNGKEHWLNQASESPNPMIVDLFKSLGSNRTKGSRER